MTSDRLRVLVAADVPEDPNSGAAGSEYQTVRALRDLGHDVEAVWEGGLPRRVRHPNLHSILELPRAYSRLLAGAASRGYDVYHFSQVFAYAAAREHRRRGLSGVFVTRSHGYEGRALDELRVWHSRLGVPRRPWPTRLPGLAIDTLIARASRLAARASDGLIVSSLEDRDFITERYGVDPERVACIAQAPPPAYQHAATVPFDAARALRMLFIGPLRTWKGFHVLQAVLDPLLDRHSRARVTLVLPESDLESGRALVSAVRQAQLQVLSAMDQADLMRIYDTHGLLLFPSLFEGFGKVVVEAMARGMCVIASRLGAARVAIEDGRSGRLVTPGDIAEFQAATSALLDHPSHAAEMGTRARAAVRDLTWAQFAQQSVSFYRSLLRRARG